PDLPRRGGGDPLGRGGRDNRSLAFGVGPTGRAVDIRSRGNLRAVGSTPRERGYVAIPSRQWGGVCRGTAAGISCPTTQAGARTKLVDTSVAVRHRRGHASAVALAGAM